MGSRGMYSRLNVSRFRGRLARVTCYRKRLKLALLNYLVVQYFWITWVLIAGYHQIPALRLVMCACQSGLKSDNKVTYSEVFFLTENRVLIHPLIVHLLLYQYGLGLPPLLFLGLGVDFIPLAPIPPS